MKKRLIGPLVVTVLLLMFLVGNASAGCIGVETGTDFGCGDTVTESCTLNENMSCTSGHGLEIGENGITIDGNGHWIDGVATGKCDDPFTKRTGIYSLGYDNTTIKNLEVTNFCHGIWFRWDDMGYGGGKVIVNNVTIDNCKVHDNGYMEDPEDPDAGTPVITHGMYLMALFNSTITNNEVYNNCGSGTSCEGGGNGVFLRGFAGYGANGQGGIILRCKKSDHNLIELNNASANYGDGIFIGGNSNTIRDNIARGNTDGPRFTGTVGDGDGIDMGRSDGSRNNYIFNNTVCNNEGTDIKVCHAEGRGNHGDENTCDTTYNYNDEGAMGCTYICNRFADFSAEPTKGVSPLKINFTDKSQPQEDIASWLWDFGDGATSNEQNPFHVYHTVDPYSYYNVSLTVNRTGGESDTETKTGYIKVWKPGAAPDADFYCERGVGEPSLPVQFTDKSIGEVTSWAWDFDNDGIVDNTTQNPSHQYSEEGIYTASLTVTGPGGYSKDTKIECVRVGSGSGEKRPLIDSQFFASARSGTAPLVVNFTDMSSTECEIKSWKWDFGDGNISYERNPTHIYGNTGTYTVSLEVTNTGGAKTIEAKTDYITVTAEAGIFDTGKPADPYPSIFGTHNGTIIPNQDITVNKMYTYPCAGTGGHTEYIRIWNESEAIEGEGHRSGYQSDYHNITISPAITLLKNHVYNYTIITGSYPQIVDARSKPVTGGTITCAGFTDANGRKYDNWIPAIKLYQE
jgi:parallel beta-helix repeat protein